MTLTCEGVRSNVFAFGRLFFFTHHDLQLDIYCRLKRCSSAAVALTRNLSYSKALPLVTNYWKTMMGFFFVLKKCAGHVTVEIKKTGL